MPVIEVLTSNTTNNTTLDFGKVIFDTRYRYPSDEAYLRYIHTDIRWLIENDAFDMDNHSIYYQALQGYLELENKYKIPTNTNQDDTWE